MVGVASGATDPLQPLATLARGSAPATEIASTRVTTSAEFDAVVQTARAEGKPILVDFTAEWCVTCKEIDRTVFAETGHSLNGPFRERWARTGGVAVYGLPISEPFQEGSQTDGEFYLVQYFERARMEHHPEAAGTIDEIRLARLGTTLFVRRPPPRLPAGQ